MSLGPSLPLSVGALPCDAHRGAALEFFELFKIPWAFYEASRSAEFGSAIASSSSSIVPETPIVFICGPLESPLDRTLNLVGSPLASGDLLKYRGDQVPLYTPAVAFDGPPDDFGLQTTYGRRVGVIVRRPGATVVRIGYDVFAEVDRLLSGGHASGEHAARPAIDIHINVVRNVLLALDMPVVEIPPHPMGHPFIVCLTHDIDFMGIRHHRLDHSAVGFVGRALQSLWTAPRIGWPKVRKNIAALLSLPAVYLKRRPDFWYPLDRYREAEGHLPSTYFFIPHAGRAGKGGRGKRAFLRAARYRVEEYSEDLRQLEEADREVGVHGIDAWCDADQGVVERRVIQDITGRDDLGIRMHWLYFGDDSPSILERAGYAYDSTMGFNDAVGYRNGTTQVFRPQGASMLLELPLNVQDTALLFPGRMHLSESEALERCDHLIETATDFGGVLTINWHDRSLAPERNWDDVYRELLIRLRARTPWFARARDAVTWFRRRRTLTFSRAVLNGNTITMTVNQTGTDSRLMSEDFPPHVISVRTGRGGATETVLALPLHGARSFDIELNQGTMVQRSPE